MPEDDSPMEFDMSSVEFDMSFSTNSRINYLLWLCNENMRKEQPLEWFVACKNLLKELACRMKEDEFKVHTECIKKIEVSVNDFQVYNMNFNANANKGLEYHPPRDVFDQLYEWEVKLRAKANKIGLLFKESYGHAI